MILIINNCITPSDERTNLHRLVKFMRKYRINHKICHSLEDVHSVDRKTVNGIIMTGSQLRILKDYNHPKLLTSLYILTDYQQPDVIPIYGLCFSCQLATMIHGGSLYQLPSLYHQNVYVQLDTNVNILHNRSEEKIHVGFNDLPIPTPLMAEYFTETGWDLSRYIGYPLSYKARDKPWYFSMYHPEAHIRTHWILLNFIENICHEPFVAGL
jgi:anthranilate/para-aminobenzoate synthase component II